MSNYPLMGPLFETMLERQGSDLYLTIDYPASVRVGDEIAPADEVVLTQERIDEMLAEILNEEQIDEFESTLEFNTAINWMDRARFRINAFRQQQHTGVVIRRIQTDIPTIEQLNLPEVYGQLIMQRRGMILLVGPTGSGKSSSLAAMVGHRNQHGSGHIITVEDPIEFVHTHNQCIISQRDVGIDTYSYGLALKNALRQRPDVVLIGEIRDRETMEHAVTFAETGHLCLATLHASNANQAVERVLAFFPEEKHAQVLLNLAINLKAVLSQRLVPNLEGGRSIAVEILLNQGLIRNLIEEGDIRQIKEVMEKQRDMGMQTFDQSLVELHLNGEISADVAAAESDNPSGVRLAIKQAKMGAGETSDGGISPITLQQDPKAF